MFTDNSLTLKWKIEFSLTTISKYNGFSTGKASLVIKPNQLPSGGICSVYPLNGTTPNTLFKFNCSGWTDSDGVVVKYLFFGKKTF